MCVVRFHPRPIHDAIEGNTLEMVKFLVENGADISVEREGKTLIDIAVAHGYQDIADYLIGKLLVCLSMYDIVHIVHTIRDLVLQ